MKPELISFEVTIKDEHRTIYSMIDKHEIRHYDWTKPLTQYDSKFKFVSIDNVLPSHFSNMVNSHGYHQAFLDHFFQMKKLKVVVKRI